MYGLIVRYEQNAACKMYTTFFFKGTKLLTEVGQIIGKKTFCVSEKLSTFRDKPLAKNANKLRAYSASHMSLMFKGA